MVFNPTKHAYDGCVLFRLRIIFLIGKPVWSSSQFNISKNEAVYLFLVLTRPQFIAVGIVLFCVFLAFFLKLRTGWKYADSLVATLLDNL